MSHLYVVYALDSKISVVEAESKGEALDTFVRDLMDDENLNYFIKDFSFGDGLLTQFYRDDQGYLFDIDQNEVPERLQQLNEQEKDDYIDSWIESNARQFWNAEPQFASEFLQELDKAKHSDSPQAHQFSNAFLVSTIKKIIQQGDWYESFDIVQIDLADTNYQVIYED